jgi:hypothetical protein
VTQLVPDDTAVLEVGSEVLRARAQQLADNFRAANTRKVYPSDMDQFRAWCAAQRPTLPAQPMTVAPYLAALAEVPSVASATWCSTSTRPTRCRPPGWTSNPVSCSPVVPPPDWVSRAR